MMQRPETPTQVHEVHDRLLDITKMVANEPLVGLFYVQQHIQRAVPNVVALKDQMKAGSASAAYALEDVHSATAAVKIIKEAGLPAIERMQKSLDVSTAALASLQRPSTSYVSSLTRTVPRATSFSANNQKGSTHKTLPEVQSQAPAKVESGPTPEQPPPPSDTLAGNKELPEIENPTSPENAQPTSNLPVALEKNPSSPGVLVRSVIDSALTRAGQMRRSIRVAEGGSESQRCGDEEGAVDDGDGKSGEKIEPSSSYVRTMLDAAVQRVSSGTRGSREQAKLREANSLPAERVDEVPVSFMAESSSTKQSSMEDRRSPTRLLSSIFNENVWRTMPRRSQSDSAAIKKLADDQLEPAEEEVEGQEREAVEQVTVSSEAGDEILNQASRVEGCKSDEQVQREGQKQLKQPSRLPSWNRGAFNNVRAALDSAVQTAGNMVQTAGGTVRLTAGSVVLDNSRLLWRSSEPSGGPKLPDKNKGLVETSSAQGTSVIESPSATLIKTDGASNDEGISGESMKLQTAQDATTIDGIENVSSERGRVENGVTSECGGEHGCGTVGGEQIAEEEEAKKKAQAEAAAAASEFELLQKQQAERFQSWIDDADSSLGSSWSLEKGRES